MRSFNQYVEALEELDELVEAREDEVLEASPFTAGEEHAQARLLLAEALRHHLWAEFDQAYPWHQPDRVDAYGPL